MTVLTSVRPTIPQEQSLERDRLVDENRRLRAELNRQHRQMQQLQAAFEEVLADKQRLETQLADVQRTMAQLMAENERLTTALNEFKQAPFKSRRRASSNQTASSSSRRGRPAGHPGQGRPRPERIDQTERIEIGRRVPIVAPP
jgi:chromosome segregation ATPase